MRPAAWLGGALLLLAWLAGAPATAARAPLSTGLPARPAHWMHIESRIESGYFQQDAAGLQALAATLAAAGPTGTEGKQGEWQSYYMALLAYRLALLTKHDGAHARPLAQRCVDRLDRVLLLDAGSAEALALQSACLGLQSHLDPWRSPFAAHVSLTRASKALQLAPDNPRVLLLTALAASDQPRLFGDEGQQAFALMQRAAAAFERQRARAHGLPGWGAADAFTDLAQDYLRLGEVVAARNVLERALLVAPEFTRARQLMAEIVSG